MRSVLFGLLALAACAHGKSGDDNGTTDGGADAPAATQDSDDSCGGLPCDAIYVAPTGADTATGTRADPVKTIGAGITKAAMRMPAVGVYVQTGEYDETVAMKAGVDVFGGFDTAWMPTTSAATTIVGASTGAVTIDAITVATALHHVTVKSGDATSAGASSIAVLVTGSSKSITLDTVTVLPGAGMKGNDGVDGFTGAGGGNGGGGGAGQEHSGSVFCDSHTVPVGGAGGSSACGQTGGQGGNPGIGNGVGLGGGAGAGGTGGGGGGQSSQGAGICNNHAMTAGDGFAGGDAANGGPGANGSPGQSAGIFSGAAYMTSDGTNGTYGGAGNGGGGGGGGGGGTTDCQSSGSSGGGGGAGGCGGSYGTGDRKSVV